MHATAPSTGIDAPRVQEWLAAHVDGVEPPCAFALISGGQSNLTVGATDARGRRLVLRRPPLAAALPSAHDVGREHRIVAALDSTAVPVPEALGLCEDPEVTGAPFCVMAFVDGLVVRDDREAAALSAAARARSGAAMVDALVALHRLEPADVGLGELGRRGGYLERQLRRWSAQWEASRDESVPAVPEAGRRLAATLPAQQRTSIVHGDFRMDNCILCDDGEVAAVLDWELCTLGDPLADLGMLALYWPSPGEPSEHLLSGVPTIAGGFAARDELVARYAAGTGLDVSALPWYLAFNQFKLACIGDGIRARTLAGAAGEPDPGRIEWLRRTVRALAGASLATLEAA